MRHARNSHGRLAAAARVRAHASAAITARSRARAPVRGLALVAALLGIAVVALGGGAQAAPEHRGQEAREAYGKLPLTFVENRGQSDQRVRYEAQGSRYAFHFARDRIALSFLEKAPSLEEESTKGVALWLQFIGANPDVEVEGEDPAPGSVNYLRGDDPERWQTDVPSYGAIVYRELWPGIDMLVRGQDGELKYEFWVKPGARPADIRLAYAGADGVAVAADGALVVDTAMGSLRDSAPVSYQEIDGERVPVESRYVLDGGADGHYGFALGDYRADREVVIDPGIAYSTFLGGSSDEDGNAVAVDSAGNAYIAGSTQSTDFPTTAGAFDRSFGGGLHDVFVTKLNADGSGVAYSTYLGGSPTALPFGGTDDLEFGRSIAVDSNGNAYVTGQTSSSDFPTTAGAFDESLSVGQNTATDGFVTKLNPQGSGLVYSTYLGGTDRDDVRSIALDGSGNAYLAGESGPNFPTTAGAFDQTAGGNGNNDVFVAKLNAAGSQLVYSTYLGGADNDVAGEVKVDADGNAYVAGGTRSADFPTTEGAFDKTRDGVDFAKLFDAFVTKVNPDGSGLVYSTFLGGSDIDRAGSLAVDAAGNAHVQGGTLSPEFPTTEVAFDTTPGPRRDGLQGTSDTFVTKLSPDGAGLVYSTFMNQGAGADIALDADNNAWLVGGVSAEEVADPANPVLTTPDAAQPQFGGGASDAHVAKLNAAGSELLYGTFLGGANSESAGAVAVDPAGDVYVAGSTLSADFPTTDGAFDRTFAGDPALFWGDAFVTKYAAGEPAPAALSSLALDPPSVIGGDASTGTAALTAAAPAGGAEVALASDTVPATVPASVTVPAGATSVTFTVETTGVSSDAAATISASYAGVTKAATLTVKAPAPAARTTTNFSGRIGKNQTVGHTVSVGATGPVDIALDWDDTRADVSLRARDPDGNVVFFDGSNAKPKNGTFEATVTGHYRFELINNSDRQPRYTLAVTHPVASSPEPEPAALSSLGLSPTSVTGGSSSTGTVTLTSAAPSGGASVALASSNAGAATVPANITVPAGQTSATFTVSTTSVSATTTSTISATYAGVTRTAMLEVTPSASTADTVSISRAEYDGGKDQLRVEASSSNASATLRVYVTATDESIGTLSGGKGEFSWPTNPENITVKSSLGGSATMAVTLK